MSENDPKESAETKSSQDLVEDGYQSGVFGLSNSTLFNYKSLMEQHEKFLANLNNVGLQIVQNAVTVANRIQNNAAETDNMVSKQAFRNVSYENASIWQLPSIDAIAAAVAEKLAATINANLPGGNTLPQGGNPSTPGTGGGN
jgi:hypothetical protein